jgi:hypothetical protein
MDRPTTVHGIAEAYLSSLLDIYSNINPDFDEKMKIYSFIVKMLSKIDSNTKGLVIGTNEKYMDSELPWCKHFQTKVDSVYFLKVQKQMERIRTLDGCIFFNIPIVTPKGKWRITPDDAEKYDRLVEYTTTEFLLQVCKLIYKITHRSIMPILTLGYNAYGISNRLNYNYKFPFFSIHSTCHPHLLSSLTREPLDKKNMMWANFKLAISNFINQCASNDEYYNYIKSIHNITETSSGFDEDSDSETNTVEDVRAALN